MKVSEYLPSPQFSGITVSILLAGALIVGAQYITAPATTSPELLAGTQPTPENDWQAALEAVQAEAPGLPEPPSEDAIQELLEAAQSSNLTSSVARSLFINLSDAGAQGLGSDIPTQEKLIAEAAAQAQSQKKTLYSSTDLTVIPQTPASLRAWGNKVVETFGKHPGARSNDALYAIGYALDYSDSKALAPLAGIGAAYTALAKSLSTIETPSTLVPLYIKLINNLATMAAAAPEMAEVLEDPLRGLAGLQSFQSADNEAGRVLTAIAEQLNKGGILFSKDEAGSNWNDFLSSP